MKSSRILWTISMVAVIGGLFTLAVIAGRTPVWGQARGPLPKVTEIMRQPLEDLPGYEVRIIDLTFPPSSASPPHRHPGHLFVYVIDGTIKTKIGDNPENIYEAGATFYEPPNALHGMTDNLSGETPARAVAFGIYKQDAPTTVPAAPH